MVHWAVRTGAVRNIGVSDEGGGLAWVVVRLRSGRQVSWNLFSKPLCDVAHGAAVSASQIVDVLYHALTPGRRSSLTRWLNAHNNDGGSL